MDLLKEKILIELEKYEKKDKYTVSDLTAINALTEIYFRLNQGNYSEHHEHSKSDKTMTKEEAVTWVSHMDNSDGTHGEHWTMEQTNDLAMRDGLKFSHITPYDWYATVNMMYSDYYKVGLKYNCNTPSFYADLSKAFLFDADAKSPKEKLYLYYKNIPK